MSVSNDYDLLRRYEPVLVFSPDERFFPLSVEDFIRQSTLWSVPLKLGPLPLLRRRWKPFRPQENLDDAIGQMASEHACKGFVYLEFVDRFALFPLFWQAWVLVAIEIGLTLLPLGILLQALLGFRKITSPGGIAAQRWPDAGSDLLLGLSLGLVLGGTALALVRRLLHGPGPFSQLPQARLRSFHTLVTLQLMISAIVGSIVVGPREIIRDGNLVGGGLMWIFGWVLAAVLALYYIPLFFRSGILQLNSLFALLSGLNDGTADAAFSKLKQTEGGQLPGSSERPFPYYGRVWPQDPAQRETHQYIALQYWFFYAFNDWRTRYNGIDDHEGDWEHITVILSREELGAEPKPTYLVYSQHILPGAFLRRAWEDPAVRKVRHGDSLHPVAYVAAGSHAHYYRRGRHGLEELLRFSKPASRLYAALLHTHEKGRTQPDMERADVNFRLVRSFKLGALGEYLLMWPRGDLPEIERVDVEELVDYAGVSPSDPLSQETGPSIGPGQSAEWECILIQNEAPQWMRYNGNWGKYVTYSGESAPRGPRLASKITDRAEWANPIDAAGLILEVFKQPDQPQATASKAPLLTH